MKRYFQEKGWERFDERERERKKMWIEGENERESERKWKRDIIRKRVIKGEIYREWYLLRREREIKKKRKMRVEDVW